jgi:hypothetical protein
MAVSEFSRYATARVCNVPDYTGVMRPTLFPRQPYQYRVEFVDYIWQENDRIDVLAFNAFGDATTWWAIANANPEVLFWDDLQVGTTVRVPRGAIR